MKLIEVKIKNFRGYKEETKLELNNLTALLGKNDVGKSTIMEALEIFFNNKTVIIEKEDLSINHDENNRDIEITCVFDNLPSSLSIDTSSTTTLEREFLLNSDGLLEIKKKFSATTQKPKPNTKIVCQHPINQNYNDLLSLKRTELKKRAEYLNIDKNKYDARNNVSMRDAIYNDCTNIELIRNEIEVDIADGKKIFTSIETYLPAFALFQADRNSLDTDVEVTDPMKIAVQQALSTVENEINIIKTTVQERALDTARRTLDKLQEMDETLAATLEPEFKTEPKFDSLFKLAINSDDGISLNKRGSGVRRLILMNFFRAEAERRLNDNERNTNIIYAIEEPETALHPSQQKMLIASLKKLSEKENCQILVTTHNPALAELIELESLRLIKKEDLNVSIKGGDSNIYAEITKELGIFPEPIYENVRGVILVEGKDDIKFLEHLSNVLKEEKICEENFNDRKISIIPTGGCNNLKFWVQTKIIEEFNIPWAVFLDSDKKEETMHTDNVRTINRYKKSGHIAICTRKREIENYFSPELFNHEITIQDFNDAKQEIKDFKRSNSIRDKGSPIQLYWPQMELEHIEVSGNYINEIGEESNELYEINEALLNIVE